MATFSSVFQTYVWLIDIINRSNGISLKQINERWVETEMSGGVPMPRNTFYYYRNAIEEMFDINIVCDHHVRGGQYRIEDNRTLRRNPLAQWLLSTMSVAGVVRESQQIRNRIVLENVPTGGHLLSVVTQAMKQGRALLMRYRKFVDQEAYETEVEPYCVKLFHQRWYMLAHRPGRDYLAIYAFDRMESVEATATRFRLPDDFDAEAHFAQLFGVFQPSEGQTAQLIRLRAYNGEWNYLRTLPLHASQHEVERTDEYVDFTLQVFPTRDLKLEILSRGENIEVLKPAALREDIREMLQAAGRRYE